VGAGDLCARSTCGNCRGQRRNRHNGGDPLDPRHLWMNLLCAPERLRADWNSPSETALPFARCKAHYPSVKKPKPGDRREVDVREEAVGSAAGDLPDRRPWEDRQGLPEGLAEDPRRGRARGARRAQPAVTATVTM